MPDAAAAHGALGDAHALVTGGGGGIGAAIARSLLAHGARVTLLGRDRARLEATVARLEAHAASSVEATAATLTSTGDARRTGTVAEGVSRVGVVVADVADAGAVDRAVSGASAERGAIAILVNNAGVARGAPFAKTDAALWREAIGINLDGTYHCTRAALPSMRAANRGRIVNVASTAALKGYAYVAAYCAAKHGVLGLTRALALELAGTGITVNAVCPGYTDTDLVAAAVAGIVAKTGRTEEQARAALVEANPQRRLVSPDEVANAVLWLCLPGSEAITGQAISVSGGEVMVG